MSLNFCGVYLLDNSLGRNQLGSTGVATLAKALETNSFLKELRLVTDDLQNANSLQPISESVRGPRRQGASQSVGT